jgi:uncharacterized protein (UPF0548 family)
VGKYFRRWASFELEHQDFNFLQVGSQLGSGRARRESATRAMQGWHSQRILGNGEIADPVIKVSVALTFKSKVEGR